jgi:hypothetical protein
VLTGRDEAGKSVFLAILRKRNGGLLSVTVRAVGGD